MAAVDWRVAGTRADGAGVRCAAGAPEQHKRVGSLFAETAAELEALRRAVVRGQPFDEQDWQQEAAARLGLQTTLRPPGHEKSQAKSPKR